MTATPSSRLRLAKQAPGDNFNAWGVVVNTAVIDMVDEAFGVVEVAVPANLTLTSNNYTSDQSRRAVLRFTGAGGFTVTVPGVEKLYTVDNRCAADVTVKTAGGSGAVVRAGTAAQVIIDGVNSSVIDPTLDKIKPPVAAVAMNGQRLTNGGAAVDDTDFIQKGQATGLVAPIAADAQASANAAAGSAMSAGMSMSGATAAASLAQQWAVSLTLVDATYFGARKYALDAAASAVAAAQFDPSSYYIKSVSDARYGMAGDTARALRVARLYTAATFP